MKKLHPLFLITMLLIFTQCKKNDPPICDIVGPLEFSEFTKGDEVPITVNASDSDGSIVEVVISIDGIAHITINNAPFSYKWATDSEDMGEHVISAVARDDENAEGNDSRSVTIIATLPSVKTRIVSSVTGTSAASGGEIISNGGESLSDFGVCWSTSENTCYNSGIECQFTFCADAIPIDTLK